MITTEQATREVLQLLNTPLVKNVGIQEGHVGTVLNDIINSTIYDNLSSGERALVNFAHAMWQGRIPAFGVVDDRVAAELLGIMSEYFLHRPLAEVALAR